MGRVKRQKAVRLQIQTSASDLRFHSGFYCDKCKLIIELDGGYHNDIEQKQYDNGRTYELNELKITVIRFTNTEVLEDLEFVLGEIKQQLCKYWEDQMKSDT